MSNRTIGLILAACLTVYSIGWADEPSERHEWEKRVVLRAGQEVQGDYFAFGSHVEISGIVHGDVYVAGGEVLIDGTVDGDAIVAGGKVTLSGHVTHDARVAGGSVTIGGQVDRNASIAGGDVVLTDSAHIHGSLLAGAGSVQAAAPVERDVRIGAGNVTVSSKIGGDLAVAAANIRLTSKASVGKNLRYWSEEEPSIDEGAQILGTVTKREVPASVRSEQLERGLSRLKMVVGGMSLFSTLLLGLLLLRIYPVFSQQVATTVGIRPWASLGLGGALLVGVPLLIILCMVTVLGIPVGLILGAMYLVTLYVGRVFVMLWIGQKVVRPFSDSMSLSWTFVIGLLAYSMLSFVPLVGRLVVLATMLLGIGALLIVKKEFVSKLRDQKVV